MKTYKHVSCFKAALWALCAFSMGASEAKSKPTNETIYTAPEQMAEKIQKALQVASTGDNDTFWIGASTSEHQCSKKCTPDLCDWSAFAEKHGLPQPTNTARYPCDFWNNYETYIKQLKTKLSLNALRISIEWALVQPKEDVFDEEALSHYVNVIACLIEHDITPMICLHHYTSPCWFANKDGFEKTANNSYFITYGATTYRYIVNNLMAMPKIRAKILTKVEKGEHPLPIASFNSPEGVAFKGYHTMEGPPANPDKKGLSWVATVLENMMLAHAGLYHAIHNDPTHKEHGITPYIGILKNITQLDAATKTWQQKMCYPLTKYLCAPIGEELQSKCIYRFFSEGKFKIGGLASMIAKSKVDHPRPSDKDSVVLDWIGLNYYSNQIMQASKRIEEAEDSPYKTDNKNYRIYAHGLYRAVKEIHKNIAKPVGMKKNGKSLPIYITETGIATSNDAKRERYYQQYLGSVLKALEEGLPVRGFLVWTAFDNYEWQNATSVLAQDRRIYGLCYVSADGQELTLKPGARWYQQLAWHMQQYNAPENNK